ncbi:hypothetical protein [Haloplanus sp. C73]|uniref:hypothetical protein n=1 Tax=Haloplanus sp. C73 TaxID=3421641 RepID=UPI003EBE8226
MAVDIGDMSSLATFFSSTSNTATRTTDIESSVSTSVVFTEDRDREKFLGGYHPEETKAEKSIQEAHSASIQLEPRHMSIRERSLDQGAEEFETKIGESLNKKKWSRELIESLEEFRTAQQVPSATRSDVTNKANNLVIEVGSSPTEAIPYEVLEALPKVGKHAEPEFQQKLKERLQKLKETTSYEESASSEGSLSWEALEEERQQYFDELGHYFDRLRGRGTDVEDRKTHMLRVFLSHRADRLQLPN